jgi:hypothetical protein
MLRSGYTAHCPVFACGAGVLAGTCALMLHYCVSGWLRLTYSRIVRVVNGQGGRTRWSQ